VPLPEPADGVTPEEFSGPEAYEAALTWFAAEHRVLQNVIEHAADRQDDEHCWKIAWCWATLLSRRGQLHELFAVQETAVLAAGRLGDRDALAHVHYEIGYVSGRLGDYGAADEHLRQSLELFAELGDLASVGWVRDGLALLLTQQDRYDEALDQAVEALRLRRSLEDSAAIAYSENAVGWILAHLGQPEAALWYCRRALEMHTGSGNRSGAADTLDSLGYAYGQLGDCPQAIAHYEQAVEMYRLLGDPHGEATSRLSLGDIQFASHQPDAARCSWELALALLAQVPGADTSRASERLRRRPERVSGNNRAGSGAVQLHSLVSYVTWGRGANAGHAQPCLAAGEHSPGRDGSTDEGWLSSRDGAARPRRGRTHREGPRRQPPRHQVPDTCHRAGTGRRA
jgi:tetratricopeptide (TPR) repeat protein